jgi:hypothetical protein
MTRDDLSNSLIHLTKGERPEQGLINCISILQKGKLLGGKGDIRSGYECVCFSEAPISKIAIFLSDRSHNDIRYRPYGVIVKKDWLYEKGGRPVIYQTENEYHILPEEMRYRHV